MKRLLCLLTALLAVVALLAQENHYARALRGDKENARYGVVTEPVNYLGSGIYWSRQRNIDDVVIVNESKEDSIARAKQFIRLCETAYEAYQQGDKVGTIVYGDSALRLGFHTPELYFFMAQSLEDVGEYREARWAFRKAALAGYPMGNKAYAAFKRRMKQRKAEQKMMKGK